MQRITAIVLAAGKSKRMGRSKPLLPLADKPVIHWCIDSLIDAGLHEIKVVLGEGGEEIGVHLDSHPVTLVWNKDSESDMAGSVRTALNELKNETDAVLVCLADYPLVSSITIQKLLDEGKKYPEKIIIPTYSNRKGHPVLFPLALINDIFFQPTLRDIIHQQDKQIHVVNVLDDGVVMDMDTPEDYLEIQKKLS